LATKAKSATKSLAASKAPSKVLKRPAPVSETIQLFQRYYPDAHCALNFETPFQLLVATILSAQCTDERVNKVTPHLFAQYPSSFEMAKARLEDIEELIKSTNFFRTKAKALKSMSEVLVEKYEGEVPQNLESLVELAGVGRKTANVVLGNAFDIVSGVVVDTHVGRLSNRMGWTKSENAVMIEQDLQKIIPREHWIQISHWLITHGRATCKARKPECDTCFLFELCPKILKNK
jgi:endonuclease-3